MRRQLFFAAALAAGLALLPVVYLAVQWPQVQAFVPMHYSGGNPDHFVERTWLRDISWLPLLAWAILTFLPQVQAGQSLFWSSYYQRRTRLVVVGSLALALTALVYRSAHHSRASLRPPTGARAQVR